MAAARKTTARKTLAVVKPGDEPQAPVEPARPKTVAEAARSGSRLELLIAMRDRIAETVSEPKCPPRDLASLTRRLDDLDEKIEALRLRAKQEGEGAAAVEDGEFDASAV